MRHLRTATLTTAVLLALTACGSSDPAAKPDSAKQDVDCTDENLSQADWKKHCADQEDEGAGTGGDGGAYTDIPFGKTYEWPDGLAVTVTEAKTFTNHGEFDEAPDPDAHEFRLHIKLTNNGKSAVKLDDLSALVEGATNGGQASIGSWEDSGSPLQGRLAPGVTVTKTDDNVLEKKYGKKIIVTVQRVDEKFAEDWANPEFVGSIK
jgi:predicted small lipoprotein YifL